VGTVAVPTRFFAFGWLDEAAAAIHHLRDGHPRGKLVITI
jgi:hypothetical protein